MKILDTMWFSGKDCVGIVLIENDFKEIKAYIGVGIGLNKNIDSNSIANMGTSFPLGWAITIFPRYKEVIMKQIFFGNSQPNCTEAQILELDKTLMKAISIASGLQQPPHPPDAETAEQMELSYKQGQEQLEIICRDIVRALTGKEIEFKEANL